MIIDDLVKVLLRLLEPGKWAVAYTEQPMARLSSGKDSDVREVNRVVKQRESELHGRVLQAFLNPCEIEYENHITLMSGIIDYSVVAEVAAPMSRYEPVHPVLQGFTSSGLPSEFHIDLCQTMPHSTLC
jgi:hypothetical protein